MSVQATSNPVDIPAFNNQAISSGNESDFVNYAMLRLGFSKEQAESLFQSMEPAEVQSYLDLVSGTSQITRKDAENKWGLSEDQLNSLFGSSNAMGVRSNPLGNLFLDFLMLSYSLSLDTRSLVSKLIVFQKDQAIQAADAKYEGAIGKFACDMFAGALTFGFLGKYAYDTGAIKKEHDAQVKKAEEKGEKPPAPISASSLVNQWYGPFGAQQFGQIATATGDYVQANYELEGAKHEADAQELSAIYQQLLSIFNSTNDKDDQIAKNIAG